MKLLAFLLAIGSAAALKPFIPLPAPYTSHCLAGPGTKSLYPPETSRAVPEYTVSLDDPPSTRWNALTTTYTEEMKATIQVIKDLTAPLFHGKAISLIDSRLGPWAEKLPEPYRSEVVSMANITGIPIGELVFFNLFFEISSACTSIVAEDPSGNIFHARNMDLGLFLGWNTTAHEWKLQQALRKDLVVVNMMKDGKLLYKTTTYVGFVGVFTAMKPNGFTMTMNRRKGGKDGGWKSLSKFLKGEYVDFACFASRETFENATTYTEAVQQLSTTPMGCPNYMIMGGTKSGEGCVITRARAGAVEIEHINATAGKWYVLKTNYDSWKDTLYLDDRRTPGNRCMNQMGRENVGFPQLFNVLSSRTNLNKLTVYSSLMHAAHNQYETYTQDCPNPCWFA